ncbi:ventrally expressed dharma/bozozok antagonist isoform X5 [Phycodurus eques]|nr:ventrally expressed dharma/bozozok antagonist isoform X5 [Phycodurus eques]
MTIPRRRDRLPRSFRGGFQQRRGRGDVGLRERALALAAAGGPRRRRGEAAAHGLHGGADRQPGASLQEERLPGHAGQGRAVREAPPLRQTDPKLVPEPPHEAEEDGAGRPGARVAGQRRVALCALPRRAAGVPTGGVRPLPLAGVAAPRRLRRRLRSPAARRPVRLGRLAAGLALPIWRRAPSSSPPGGVLPGVPAVLLTAVLSRRPPRTAVPFQVCNILGVFVKVATALFKWQLFLS